MLAWKCNHGHAYLAVPVLASVLIENNSCPCCVKLGLAEEVVNFGIDEFASKKSMYNMDYALFDGEINKMFIQTDENYINRFSYWSRKGVMWNINGKEVKMCPRRMTALMTEKYQDKLKRAYELNDKAYKMFDVKKCEACGRYIPHYIDDYNYEKLKCPVCKEYIIHPYSLGRWLDNNIDIKEILQAELDDDEYKKIRGLDRNDEYTTITLTNLYRVINTNAFSITHGITKF
jgi:ABC-type uncharacterized transport system substrate-binding protein